MQRGRNGRRAESRYGEGIRNPRARQRAFCVAAGPDEPDLAELRELLRTAGVAVAGELYQRRPRPDPPAAGNDQRWAFCAEEPIASSTP